MKENEQDLRALWDSSKCISKHTMGIPEAEEKKRKTIQRNSG